MSENRKAIPLTAHPIQVGSPEFTTILAWPYADSFVHRLLRDDIPRRALFGHCRIFIYRDPRGQPVGFGTLDVCGDCSALVANAPHPYIPLLAVNPTIQSLGYGTSILHHLVSEAAVLARLNVCADILFLDVYTASTKARALYDRAGFQAVTGEIFDAVEKMPYIVMAKRVSAS